MMFVGIIFIPFLIVFVCFRIFAVYNRDSDKNGKNVAFLHPYCYGGGGGEVVLWTEIAHMLENRIKLQINKIIIYTATIEDNKPATLSFVLKKVESRFEITIDENNLEYLELVPLYHHRYIEPKYHKFAAIFTQSLVTIILALEGLYRYTPQIFVDTTGIFHHHFCIVYCLQCICFFVFCIDTSYFVCIILMFFSTRLFF